jgi:hypothetical protein
VAAQAQVSQTAHPTRETFGHPPAFSYVSSRNTQAQACGRTRMQGPKTHEQQLRTLERRPDMPDARRQLKDPASPKIRNPDARQSEFSVGQQGMNQESDHDKHNDAGQSGHQPQKRTPAEEKQD